MLQHAAQCLGFSALHGRRVDSVVAPSMAPVNSVDSLPLKRFTFPVGLTWWSQLNYPQLPFKSHKIVFKQCLYSINSEDMPLNHGDNSRISLLLMLSPHFSIPHKIMQIPWIDSFRGVLQWFYPKGAAWFTISMEHPQKWTLTDWGYPYDLGNLHPYLHI